MSKYLQDNQQACRRKDRNKSSKHMAFGKKKKRVDFEGVERDLQKKQILLSSQHLRF